MGTFDFPLSRITLSFITGILLAYKYNPNPASLFLITIGGIFVLLFFYLKKQQLYFGVLVYLVSFFIGMVTQVAHTDYLQKKNYTNQLNAHDQEHKLEIRLDEKLKNSPQKQRYIALVKRIDEKESSGKILITIADTSGIYDIGSILLVNAVVKTHKPPKNPNQFDYGKYLANKSVLAQLNVDPNAIKIGKIKDKTLWYFAAKIRNEIIQNLKKNNFGKQELAVVVALILGQQQEISPEIIQDYQYAGAIHILSVSGLHVGFILLFIDYILSLFPKRKHWNLIRFITIVISLWIFALIAGLSPSVVRSVTMFSFVAAGMCLKRETNIFHTLMVSILLILLVAPHFIFDIGFQLSYISLFFILWLQPLLASIWTPKNKLARYFWDILTVSFAAQVGALPLSIYYFHQFPGLFFITNLVILPALGIIMGLGVLVMLMAFFDFVPKFSATILEWLIHALNKVINEIASFETFIIKDIPLNFYLLFSLYLFLTATILWFKKPGCYRLVFSLVTLLLLQASFVKTNWEIHAKKEMIIFHVTKKTLVTERTGKKVILHGNDSLLQNKSTANNLNTYLVANFCTLTNKTSLKNTYYYNKSKILILDSVPIYPKDSNPDILLITQSAKINLQRLLETYQPKIIIADGSNYKSYVALWKKTCAQKRIPFHATAEKGFYKIE